MPRSESAGALNFLTKTRTCFNIHYTAIVTVSKIINDLRLFNKNLTVEKLLEKPKVGRVSALPC